MSAHMRVPWVLGGLWLGFAGTHLVLSSSRLRPALVARLGLQPFLGLYSVVALGFFVPLVWLYFTHRHAGPLLWTTIGPPDAARAVNHVLMAAALVLLVGSFVPGSRAPSGMIPAGPQAARGLLRVTRHPLFAGLGLFGVAHLLVNGNLGDVVFFAGFPLFAWIGARHQDERKTRGVAGYAELVRTTSIVPFGAIVTARQRLAWRELPLVAVAAGLGLTVILRVYHDELFGP